MNATTFLPAALLCCAVAGAAEPPATLPDPKEVHEVEVKFASLDRDHDNRISRKEAAAERQLERRFAAVDSDADGFLSKSEFEARPKPEPFE